MNWLRRSGHQTVLEPFEKALRHFLEGQKRPELYADAITDAYEALEALARIVTGKTRDLSAIQEEFLSKLRGKDFHRKLLRAYIEYGCHYRHAETEDTPRPRPSAAEAEFFVYQTGLFIRLVIEAS